MCRSIKTLRRPEEPATENLRIAVVLTAGGASGVVAVSKPLTLAAGHP